MESSLIALIPLFPLVGFPHQRELVRVSCQLRAKRPNQGFRRIATGTLATLAIFASFVVSLDRASSSSMAWRESSDVLTQTAFQRLDARSATSACRYGVPSGCDSLTTLFTLVITGVGTLIHLYSIGYMGHDETPGKFFCYLNLFCFAMLMLVLGWLRSPSFS